MIHSLYSNHKFPYRNAVNLQASFGKPKYNEYRLQEGYKGEKSEGGFFLKIWKFWIWFILQFLNIFIFYFFCLEINFINFFWNKIISKMDLTRVISKDTAVFQRKNLTNHHLKWFLPEISMNVKERSGSLRTRRRKNLKKRNQGKTQEYPDRKAPMLHR